MRRPGDRGRPRDRVRAVPFPGGPPVGKHFPGHGARRRTPTKSCPSSGREEVAPDREFLPFRGRARGDPGPDDRPCPLPGAGPGLPATLSRKILHGLFREQLWFRGMVFSDALEMKAITPVRHRGGGGDGGFRRVRRRPGVPGGMGAGGGGRGARPGEAGPAYFRRAVAVAAVPWGGFGLGGLDRTLSAGPAGGGGGGSSGALLLSCGTLRKVQGEHFRTINHVILENVEEHPPQVEARLPVVDPFEEQGRVPFDLSTTSTAASPALYAATARK